MPGRFREKLSSENGFTLIELVTVIVIMGVLVGLSIGIIAVSGESVQQVFNQTNSRSELRMAMRVFRNDFQKLSVDSILTAQSDQLSFYDIDGNYVNYHMVGYNLVRNNENFLNNVRANPFEYLDQDYIQVESAADLISFIRLNLIIERNGHTKTLTDVFYARN